MRISMKGIDPIEKDELIRSARKKDCKVVYDYCINEDVIETPNLKRTLEIKSMIRKIKKRSFLSHI